MQPALDRIFLDFSINKLRQLFSRIEDCLGKLNSEQIWVRGSENENAVGNLVLHLSGNVRQWIISAVGGAPDVRVRDREFSTRGGLEKDALLGRLRSTVEEATAVLEKVTPERLAEKVTVQSYHIPAMEAVYHVVEHFAQHTGQILFATKLLTGSDLGYYRHLTGASGHGEKTP